ncbi:hypothetical protein AAFN85_00990 [Mucilaginibacter sp. CAU 1740]|uniref:hypothetical protein n=1 Tax=Mucilaginibacter sp. CAU 1740 TaxID=3140365 RepID=UPI00325BC473
MKQFLLVLFALSFFCSDNLFAQGKLNGVYAGCEFSPSPIFGGGMSRRDISVLFRPDGTFNDVLERADWKTNVSGKYEISSGKVTLKYAKGSSVYTLKGNSLFGYGYQMDKVQGNTIPAGYYSFVSAMGGSGGSTTYVGATTRRGLNFDGKGHFSNSRLSTTAISGENVAGGSTASASGSGTYKINEGALTLTFNDGRTEQHSFFCDLNIKTRMAVVDGSIYFSESDDNNTKPTTAAKTARTANTSSNNASTVAPDGKALLLKANAAHGGDKLNTLKTVRLTGSVSGLKVIELIDIPNSKVRVEVWKNGKPVSVQQAEGNTGWQWNGSNKSDLPANNVAEVKTALYTGVLGLRKPLLSQLQIVKTQKVPNNNIYTVACKLNGADCVFAINDQSQLMAYGYQLGSKTSYSVVSDLRPVQGITLPFHENSTSGDQKLNIQYDNIDMNPVLDAQNWATPTGN